jgi:hypothetical protein
VTNDPCIRLNTLISFQRSQVYMLAHYVKGAGKEEIGLDPEVRLSRFNSHLCHMLIVQSWAINLLVLQFPYL